MRRAPFVTSLSAVGASVVFARSNARAASAVVVLYAGSLVTIMENVVRPAVAKNGLDFKGEAKGSVALANLIKSGLRSPDVFVSADTKVLDDLMSTTDPKSVVSWYATFATTRLLVGYSTSSPFANDFVAVNRGTKKLADVLLSPGLKIGRTDPTVDPKGYRTIIAAHLLEAAGYGPGFATKLLGDDRNPAQIFAEEALLARLETGDLDAAFLYATESATRRVPAVELPASANLGDPAQAAHYATASVTVAGVKRVGGPAIYALTIPTVAPDKTTAETFVTFLLGSQGRKILEDAGVTVVRPMLVGDRKAVPAAIAALAR